MNQFLMALEENFADMHDNITSQLILEHLLKNGNVSIEEAKFYKDFSGRIIHESSHLLIPSKEELMESLLLNESEAKILVDPETGEKYIYNMENGELVPAGDDMDSDDLDEPMDDDLDEPTEDPGMPDDMGGEVLNDNTLNENEILVEKLLNTLKN